MALPSSLASAVILDNDDNIYTIRSDGTDKTYLTNDNGPGTVNTGASWSADGSKIVYEHQAPGERAAIWSMNADGSGKRQLTFGSITGSSPVFSADGNAILFTGVGSGGGPEIWTMNADGSQLHALTST